MAADATRTTWRTVLLALVVSLGFLLAVPAATPARPLDHVESSPVAAGVPAGSTGILGPHDYRSPQFGFRIGWSDPWTADRASTESNPAIALDRLSLTAGTARFQVFFVAAEGETAAEYAERLIDFRISYDPTTEVIATGERRGLSWIAYSFESDGRTVLGVAEISLSDDGAALQMVEVMDHEESFEEAFQSTMDTVEVAGGTPFRVLHGWPGESRDDASGRAGW